VTPKFVSPSDPAAQWTGAMRGPAFFAYADNYLIDVKFGIIVDVEASRAIRQAEVGAAKTMIERTEECFDLKPDYLAADTAYGSAETLNWVVNEKRIAPHIPVVDKSRREDGSLSRGDFTFDKARNVYICPQGKLLHTTGYVHDGTTLLYRARVSDCGPCPLKPRCCPKTPERKIPRSIHEDARDLARASALPRSSSRAAIASGSRCYLPISSASYDLAGSDCAARAAHKMSSRSAPSRRTSAALQSWLLDRRQQQSRALRNRSNAHQRPVGERIIRVRLKRPQREPHD
jgi:hypothetical protein